MSAEADDDLNLQEALYKDLADHGFAPDGGINDRWVVGRFGPIPVCFPNAAVRKKAVPFHDFNHVLAGYGHDNVGEAEIGAWELASGCKGYVAAWILNWTALLLGVRSPRRLYSAFVRGRHCQNLYGANLKDFVDRSLIDVRRDLGLDANYRGTPLDAVLFTALVALSPLVSLVPLLVSVATSPVWLSKGIHRQHRG